LDSDNTDFKLARDILSGHREKTCVLTFEQKYRRIQKKELITGAVALVVPLLALMVLAD